MFAPGTRGWLGTFAIKSPFIKDVGGIGEIRPILWTWTSSWLYNKWCKFGWRVAYRAVKQCIKKHPYLIDELLDDISFMEWLVGTDLHRRYWKK